MRDQTSYFVLNRLALAKRDVCEQLHLKEYNLGTRWYKLNIKQAMQY